MLKFIGPKFRLMLKSLYFCRHQQTVFHYYLMQTQLLHKSICNINLLLCTVHETLFISLHLPACLSQSVSRLSMYISPPPLLRSQLTRISFLVNLPAPLFRSQLTSLSFLVNLPAPFFRNQLTSLSFLVNLPAPHFCSQLTSLSFLVNVLAFLFLSQLTSLSF